MSKRRMLGSVGCSILLTGTTCGVLRAQTQAVTLADNSSAPTDGLEEIVVTARKRNESLIDVPVAVSVVTGAQLARQGLTDLNQIVQLAPQVMVAQSQSGTGASFSVRGIGTTSQDPGLDQSVGVVLDGTSLSRGQLVDMTMFDLAQVEVLKGPQVLFFGKSSPAGVISLSSASPTDTWTGYATAGWEFIAQEKYLEAALSGPITDQLKVRVAVRGSDMLGWLNNVAVPTTSAPPLMPTTPGAPSKYAPGARQLAGRITALWMPSENFSATARFSEGLYKDEGGTTQGYCAQGAPPTVGGLPDTHQNCTFDTNVSIVGVDPRFITPDWPGYAGSNGSPLIRDVFDLGSLTLKYSLPHVDFTALTSYFDLGYLERSNFDATSYALVQTGTREETQVFSQEVRAVSSFSGPLNFTAGIYYEHDDRETGTAPIVLFLGPDAATGSYFNLNSSDRTASNALSAFGQIRWNILPQLELAAGARWSRDQRRVSLTNLYDGAAATPIFQLVPVGISTVGESSNTNASPEITLTYKPQPDLMVYAAYKTGYKAGGFGTPYLYQDTPAGVPPTGADLAFQPERVRGEEIGFKAELADRRLRIESDIYNYRYSDLQLSVFNPTTFSYAVKNAATAVTRGAELSLDWQILHGMRAFSNIAYNIGKYLNYPSAQCYVAQTVAQGCVQATINGTSAQVQNFDGRPLLRAPKWNLQAGVSFETNVSASWAFAMNSDISYTTGYYTDSTQDPLAYQGGFARVNAGIRLYSADDRYEIAVIGRNLANIYYRELSAAAAFAVTSGQFTTATPRFREVKLQATYRW